MNIRLNLEFVFIGIHMIFFIMVVVATRRSVPRVPFASICRPYRKVLIIILCIEYFNHV